MTFDNDSAVLKISPDTPDAPTLKVPVELFLRFKNHYNFRTHFCNAYSPNEKASVENSIKTLRRKLLSPMPEIEDLAEFNRALLPACDGILHRKKRRGAEGMFVDKMFELDKRNLSALPATAFEVANYKKRLCDKMGCVMVDGKYHYYLAPRFREKIVYVNSAICFRTFLTITQNKNIR